MYQVCNFIIRIALSTGIFMQISKKMKLFSELDFDLLLLILDRTHVLWNLQTDPENPLSGNDFKEKTVQKSVTEKLLE